MKRPKALLLLAVVLALLSVGVSAEVPKGHLGKWDVDFDRMFVAIAEDSFSSLDDGDPVLRTKEDMDRLVQDLKSGMRADLKVEVVFTESTVTMVRNHPDLNREIPYRVISSNSDDIVIEFHPEDEEPRISSFIEGGLALSHVECLLNPGRCLWLQGGARKNGSSKQGHANQLVLKWLYLKKP